MTKDDVSMIKHDIKNGIYYLSYPSPVSSKFWKDGNGIEHYMYNMKIEHLDNCIKKIDKDLEYMNTRPEKVSEWLVRMANAKKDELRTVLVKKVGKF